MDISSLTTYDNVTISATYLYLTEDKFNCEEKLKGYAKREGMEKATERMAKQNGCGVRSDRHRYEVDGIRYHQCVCGFRNHGLGFYLELERNFQKGLLPFEGSYLDQPSKIIEIIERMTQLRLDKEYRDYEKQTQDNKLKQNNQQRL